MTKVFVVLTAVLSIALSTLFISAAAMWDNWKKLAQDYEQQRDAAITRQMNAVASAEAALAMRDDAVREAQRLLNESRAKAEELANELARVRSELAEKKNEALAFEAGRTKLQEILDVATGELKALQKQNQDLLTQNIDLQSRNARLNSRVLELTTQVTILTDENRNMQEKLFACEQQQSGVAAAEGGVRTVSTPQPELPAGAVAAVPTVKGQIRGEIIDVQGNYASINIGSSSGVVRGLTFMVHRGGNYLGELVIDSVRPNEAGGKLQTLASGEIRRGDPVIYGLEE
jgi:hypothetical protein